MWTDHELRSLKMHVSPLITIDDVRAVDRILQCGNESQTGEDIRKTLFEAGFRVVKIDPPLSSWTTPRLRPT